MIVNLSEILKIAEEKSCAIGAFNTPNLTTLKAVISAAEELSTPVIIMHAEVHEEMGLCTMEEIAPLMRMYAERAKVPVCMHLDHGTDMDYVMRGMELGFTSVMYDGSELCSQKNYENTKTVVADAKKKNISVEAEIGSMGSREGGAVGDESIYTDPDEAKKFVNETGIDALACAFGTVHGVYLKQPKLDFERLDKINRSTSVPLVMHGGSGLTLDDYKKSIALGIRKINYYTYMAKAGGAAVAAMSDTTYFHDVEIAAGKAIKEDVKRAIKIFLSEE